MKKLLLLFVIIALGIGICVALICTLLGDLSTIANDFFLLSAQDKMEEAYEYTSVDFQKATDVSELTEFLESTHLNQYSSSNWYSSSIQNKNGYLEGTIITNQNEAVPLMIDFVKESGSWKIFGMQLLAPDPS